jgi:Immunity protein 35
MITFEEAKQIALDKIRPDCALIDDATMEKSYGWYFRYQSKAYIQSGDVRDMLFGSGGFIVERDDGYVFEFGSRYPLERNLAAYEAGFKYDTYDLTILSVSDILQTVRLLLSLRMKYVIPEEENGTVWKIPQGYTEVQIRSALASLPYTFLDQKFYFQFEVFLSMDKAGCCKYQLHGHRTGKMATLLHQATG